MIHIRIEAAGYVLKDSGVGYAVGKVFPKKLKTGGTETVRSGTYYFSLSSALRVFARKVFRYAKTDRERFFAQLLLRFSIMGGKTSPAEGLRKARRWGGVSKRELARRTGVSRTTIKKIENQGGRPMFSTLLKLLDGCRAARW